MEAGNRKSTIAVLVATALVAAGQFQLAFLLAVCYLGVNALLALTDKHSVGDDESEE